MRHIRYDARPCARRCEAARCGGAGAGGYGYTANPARGRKEMYGKRTARRAVLGLAALVSLVTACASGSAAAGGRGGLTVRVTNDLVPPASITVWITNELGSRRRLGTVAPDAQQQFASSPISQSLEHRLIAEA